MRKNYKYLICHPSFSLESVKGSSNYKIIKSGRSLDLAYQLGAMTRRDCHVASLLTMTIEGLTPPVHSYIRGGVMGIIAMTIIGLFSFSAHAECTPTPDCASIGYTETSCEGDSLKCPFDITKLYCIPCDTSFKYDCTGIGEIGSGASCNGKYIGCKCSDSYELVDGVCICDSSFKYTCSGTGYSSGSGTSCNGKYKSCTCSANYTWNGSICNLSCSSSYKYTCSGTGYTGGSGTSCGGKYTACTCINDGTSCYVWNGSACTKGTCATGSMEPETPGIID